MGKICLVDVDLDVVAEADGAGLVNLSFGSKGVNMRGTVSADDALRLAFIVEAAAKLALSQVVR